MVTKVTIPDLGESVTEVIIDEWLKNDGDFIAEDEPICTLESDKANVDLPSPAAGVLKTLKNEGDTVQVGDAVASIEVGKAGAVSTDAKKDSGNGKAQEAPEPTEEKKPEIPAPAKAAETTDEQFSPSVRRLLQQENIDPAAIKGTGKGGRILKEDIQAHISASKKAEEKATARVERSAKAGDSPAIAFDEFDESLLTLGGGGVKRVTMSKIRRQISKRLVAVKQNTAMLTTFNEVNMSAIMDIRKKYKERFNEVHGVNLGIMSFFARACILALEEYPRVNASIDEDDIVYHEYVNLGIAVSTDRGLVVPVMRNAESMDFAKIELEIKRLALAARDGKLNIPELSGSTFSITNGGIFGSLLSTPILNPPESGILGMHSIEQRPVAVNGEVKICPMMNIALSYDHRLIDGKESVGFLIRMKQVLEDPARLMLGI